MTFQAQDVTGQDTFGCLPTIGGLPLSMEPLEHPAVKTHAAIKARKCIQLRRLSAPIGSCHSNWTAEMRGWAECSTEYRTGFCVRTRSDRTAAPGGDTADVGKGKRNRKSRKEGSRLDAHRRRSRWRHRTGARIAAWRSRGVDAGAVAATAVPMTNAWLELPELKLRRGRWASTRVRGRRCASASPPPSVNSGSGARQPSQLPALAHCLQPLGGSSCRGFSRSARRSSRPRRACLPVIARWCGVAIGYRLLTNWPVCRLSSERSASNAVGALNPD